MIAEVIIDRFARDCARDGSPYVARSRDVIGSIAAAVGAG
jgi:hypothetical protein